MDFLQGFGLVLVLSAAVLSGGVLFRRNKTAAKWGPLFLVLIALIALLSGCRHIPLVTGSAAAFWALCLLRGMDPRDREILALYEDEKKKRHDCEQRYRKIFEGSDSVVLLMDTDFRIMEANLSVKKHLGLAHSSIVNTSLLDLITIDEVIRGSADISRLALEERLKSFLREKRPTTVTFPVKAKDGAINVRCILEYITQQRESTIMATLSPVDMDHLTEYLIREEQVHSIDNQIVTVDEICKRLTRNLVRYTGFSVKNQILLGLREIVLNAMEHGNLEIDFDMKSNALEQREYMTLLRERQNDPRYNKRRIRIRYILEPTQVKYVITDEGKGFNHTYFARKKHYKDRAMILLHGRGIMLSRNIFDEVKYSKKGTEVTLIKRFQDS